MHLPSPEEHYTFFALVGSVGGGESDPEGDWPDAGFHPFSLSCPRITSDWQSLVLLRRDDAMAANKTIDLLLDHLGRLWELRGRSVA